MKNTRNAEVDFWRLIGSIFIVLYHSKTFFSPILIPSNYAVTVEFFFLLSGYFFARNVYRDRREFRRETIGTETVRFIGHKMRGFLSFFLFGFVTAWAAWIYCSGMEGAFAPAGLYELLFLSQTGMPKAVVNNPDWYLSTMLIAMFLLYPLFRYRKDLFSAVIAPAVGIGAVGYIYVTFESYLRDTEVTFPPKLVVRAFAGVCLGVVVYRLSEFLKKFEIGRRGAILLSVVGTAAMLGASVLMASSSADLVPLLILLFMTFITISTSGKAAITARFSAERLKNAGRYSLSLYLTHTAVRVFLLGVCEHHEVLGRLFQNGPVAWIGMLIYLLLSFAFAALAMPVCRAMDRGMDRLVARARANLQKTS